MSALSPTDDVFPSQGRTQYEVYAIPYARAMERSIRDNFMRKDMHDGPMPLDFYMWLIRNEDRTILVDTGFGERAARERGRDLDIHPIEALAKIGLPAAEITDVVLSHLHFDHAGNLDRFPNARIHIQDAEVAYATGRCMCHAAMRWPFDVEDAVAIVRSTFAGQTCFHNGNEPLYDGISLHLLPGHSRGLQGVRVNTKRGPILLASDAMHVYANLLRDAPSALTIDVAETLESFRVMQQIVAGPSHIIPGHDPRIRQFFPAISSGGVAMIALHELPVGFDKARIQDLA
jgi:glyoxylase-like metal-dependent hydrolase (beta-lactamase superfamily II)